MSCAPWRRVALLLTMQRYGGKRAKTNKISMHFPAGRKMHRYCIGVRAQKFLAMAVISRL